MAMVGMARFELATSSSRTKRATGLRYIPLNNRAAKLYIFLLTENEFVKIRNLFQEQLTHFF
jgi:hypothetical protein